MQELPRRTLKTAGAGVAWSLIVVFLYLPLLNRWGVLRELSQSSLATGRFDNSTYMIVLAVMLVSSFGLASFIATWPHLSIVWLVWYLLFPWGPWCLLMYMGGWTHKSPFNQEVTLLWWIAVPVIHWAVCHITWRKTAPRVS
ncbi:hypothetical protein [Fimbriimonas ginsengisoli]|uniref:Uncharacterized protein n=1 Tax=Fimbriimonas ginsengisoli Gsoil 348 TaxID=661478 RepID=A0A068NM34_FIMGI|nr:hypothetical protein [Fimbriimonas ginsengisoli]AIE84603.1 hypothetical protein OP10G_1235 [Fimbriimonas ginsengisoli Gsoil 348]